WDTSESTKLAWITGTVIPQYQQRHPNVTINYQQIPTSALETKVFVSLGTGTAADVMTIAGYDLPVIFPKNVLAPAEDRDFNGGVAAVISSYLPGLLAPEQYKGRLYALPVQMNAYSLAMNNAAFAAAGLDPTKDAPKTWDQLATLAKSLTKTDSKGHVVQKGFDLRFTSGDHWLTDFFMVAENQLGGQVLDAHGDPVFNDPTGVAAMELVRDKMSSPYPLVTQNSSAAPYADFASGQDAMAAGGPNMGAVVVATNPKMANSFTFAPLPQIDPAKPANYSYSFNMAVNASSSPDVKRVAWDFISFALSNSAGWFNATKMLQPHTNWYAVSPAKDTPGIGVFVHDLSIAKPAPRTQYYSHLQSIIAAAVQKVVLSKEPVHATLDSAVQSYKLAVSQG
ncbi:MAG: extracellular solute-binding protein, partial [Candidatus Dormibacteraceae bacterium]